MTAHRQARILIVESDPRIRTMLELAFSYDGGGYQVSSAPSGSSALLQLGIVRPDLILLDLDMPDRDGWQALERIRQLSMVPVVAICGVDAPEVHIGSLVAGADYCLTKPFGLRELHARVRALLRRAGSVRARAGMGDNGYPSPFVTQQSWRKEPAPEVGPGGLSGPGAG